MKKLKGFIIALLCLLLAGGGLFAFQKYRNKNKSVDVVAVSDVGMGWIEDELRSSGIIYEKDSQSVFVNSNQLVKEVYVTEGQAVKAGDKLLAYDLESQKLAVDLKSLDVERARNHIAELQKELIEIRNMKPYVPTPVPTYEPEPEPTPTPTPTPTPKPEKEKKIDAWTLLDDLSNPINTEAAGTIEDPYVFLATEDGIITGKFFKELKEKGKVAVIEVREGNKADGELIVSHTFNGARIREYGEDEAFYAISLDNANGSGGTGIMLTDIINFSRPDEGVTPTPSSEENEQQSEDGEDRPYTPGYGEDDSSGYTAQEIAEMAAAKQREIASADLSYRKLQLEYKIMQEELGDGIVYAKKDGVVKISHAPNDIPQDGSPFIKIASGEGAMIQGTISEMLLDKVQVGQTLTASSWETGEEYVATVASVDDLPATNSYFYGEGNPNASYYNFYAYIENGDEVPENTYLDIKFDSVGGDEEAVFISRVYIRSDALGKYVMIDEDGVLKKQYVKTGKTYWGEYTQVLSGLSNENYIAFPYGDGAIEGVKTKVSEEGGVFY